MKFTQLEYGALLTELQQDNTIKRFNTKIILVNTLNTYLSLISYLESKSDIIIKLSDSSICAGNDTIPALNHVLSIITDSASKNILVTSVGEYLRVAEKTERANRYLFSIISHQAHSSKRVWIPIFAAKEEFIAAIGNLDEEHYPDTLYEIEEPPAYFSATVYSKLFESEPDIVNAIGIRNWLRIWDEKKIHSGMSFSTRFIKQYSKTEGIYTQNIISDPFTFLTSRIENKTVQIDPSLGSDSQWLFLASKATQKGMSISLIIENALNMLSFDAEKVLGSWRVSNWNTKWAFWLWYKIGLNDTSDYISYAVSKAAGYSEIPNSIEMSIFTCFDNPNFDYWITQRKTLLENLGITKFSDLFWKSFASISDSRKQLKLLSGRTIDEQAKIIEIISHAIKEGHSISEFQTILTEKYPSLIIYLKTSPFLSDDLTAYISEYKRLKIADTFDVHCSESTEKVNIYDFDTRSTVLNKIKNTRNAYYLWIDGMGVEWIDLLIHSIALADNELINPAVMVGTAVLPSITKVNMECADPDTVSEKINNLDALSHIKDKNSGENYYTIIAKQIKLIEDIAQKVAIIASTHPAKDIVITSDHGMSRLAALGFHNTEGIKVDSNVEVCSMGRYCKADILEHLPSNISHTIKDNGVVAFKNHSHFVISGYAPGEIHGGAAPEELLVPIIHYKRKAVSKTSAENCAYTADTEAILLSNGSCNLIIHTTGPVNKVVVEIHSKRISAVSIKANEWSASIPNLSINHNYKFRIYLNNIFSDKEESFYVKAAGMAIDDDLF